MIKPVNTIIVDSDTGKIREVLTGPKHLHEKNIGNFQVAVEYSGTIEDKIGVKIEEEWSIVDDENGSLERSKSVAIRKIDKHKYKVLPTTTTGEVRDGNKWTPGDITIGYDSHTSKVISQTVLRFRGSTDPLSGRDSFSMLIGKKVRKIFTSVEDFWSFYNSYINRLNLAGVIASEKIQEVLSLENKKDVTGYSIESGWEELDA